MSSLNLDDNPTLLAIGQFLAAVSTYIAAVEAQADDAAKKAGGPSMYGELLSPRMACEAKLNSCSAWLRISMNSDRIRLLSDPQPSEVWEMHGVSVDEECEVQG